MGKQRAYSSETNSLKSRGAIYNHSKFPILIQDTGGFDINYYHQDKSIHKELIKNSGKEMNDKIHIVFMLISGPLSFFRA